MKPINHRNLFNGDCTFLFTEGYLPDKYAPYTVDILHRFVDLLADNGVDTYLQNPNASKPWWPSRAVPSILDGYTRGDREFVRHHFKENPNPAFCGDTLDEVLDREVQMLDRLLDLQEKGIDWVAEIAARCHTRGISPWLSIRMNDMHGAQGADSYMDCTFRKQPAFRFSGRDAFPSHPLEPYRMGMDYGHREVRDYQFAIIRELVEDYDYEGLELDWQRCSFCCEPPASREAIDTITEWIAEIRTLTRARGEKIGKPYPFGLTIPARVEMLREIGLDVRAMAREGLIDFISPSNFWQATWDLPYGEMREIVGDDVAIYGRIDNAPNWLPARPGDSDNEYFRLLSSSTELVRGNAAGKLATGCDGIETYNYFCSDDVGFLPNATQGLAQYHALRGLEDLNSLRGTAKHYALASAGTRVGNYMWPEWEVAEQIPCILEPNTQRTFQLSMCAEPTTEKSELLIQIVVEKNDEQPHIAVSFNGSWPHTNAEPTDQLLLPTGYHTHHVADNRAYNFAGDPGLIKEGWNQVTVINGNQSDATTEGRSKAAIRIVSVELLFR